MQKSLCIGYYVLYEIENYDKDIGKVHFFQSLNLLLITTAC